MRSLPQKIVLSALFLFHSHVYAQNHVNEAQLFNVVMPYESVGQDGELYANPQDVKVKEAMKSLLLRLTGRPEILETQIGQSYIGKAKNWLANYNLKPRYEDGVAVGKNIHYKFDATRLKIDFSKKNIQIWPVHFRPSTLVMGSYIQQGQLQKLTDEILDYRVDVDFRERPEQLGLPFLIADNAKNWVYPIDPEQNRQQIQEALLAEEQQNLLSFKIVSKPEGLYSLDWYLYSITGEAMHNEISQGYDRQQMLQEMFQKVMQLYVKQSAEQVIVKNDLLLNISGVGSGDILQRMETELRAQQSMVSQVMLTTASKEMIQFRVQYQGDDQIFKAWLKGWPMVKPVPLKTVAEIGVTTSETEKSQKHSGIKEKTMVAIESVKSDALTQNLDNTGSTDEVDNFKSLEQIDLMFNSDWVAPEDVEETSIETKQDNSQFAVGASR